MCLPQGLYPRELSTRTSVLSSPPLLIRVQFSRMPESVYPLPEFNTGGERRCASTPARNRGFDTSGRGLSARFCTFLHVRIINFYHF